ncbi:hypothetical protein, partial [Bifidobacterium magnum]|uniref:hypothetical protein n=1 Tax=Bifidobacterium magnum TaxID=1692 RepID=UPI0019554159
MSSQTTTPAQQDKPFEETVPPCGSKKTTYTPNASNATRPEQTLAKPTLHRRVAHSKPAPKTQQTWRK